MEYEPVVFNLVELANETISLASAAAENKEIQLSVLGPDQLSVFADHNMIFTVLRNLVSNAIKFTPLKGSIRLHLEQTDAEVIFKVEDSGVGISKENVARLFQIDKTFSKYGTADEKGTGLGLILCKEFVDKHNGKISVESTPGKGSTFIVSLPK
jgi:signal transduction histidine kinase